MVECQDCFGTRSTPDVFGDLGPCPSCVVVADEGESWVVIDSDEAS